MPKTDKKTNTTALAKIEPQNIATQSLQLPREMIERDPLGACAYFAACAKKAQLVSLAAQVFAGAAISKIKSDIGITSGKRTDLANDERLKDGWDVYCKNSLGISKVTAANWERIAKLVAAKIDGIDGLTAASLERFSELADDAFNQLQKAISKVTDGRSQSQLLLEWKMCAGGAKRGTSPSGDGGGGNAAPQGTPPGYTDEEFEEYLAADQTGKAAIDHARALIFALRQFVAVTTLLVHIPEHYGTEIEERVKQAVEVLP